MLVIKCIITDIASGMQLERDDKIRVEQENISNVVM